MAYPLILFGYAIVGELKGTIGIAHEFVDPADLTPTPANGCVHFNGRGCDQRLNVSQPSRIIGGSGSKAHVDERANKTALRVTYDFAIGYENYPPHAPAVNRVPSPTGNAQAVPPFCRDSQNLIHSSPARLRADAESRLQGLVKVGSETSGEH